ncbi:GNAT family N-acetyltransferase [Caulobacter sp.]|uniref:GNAT family N-acetyltransferase n=1 Tax=Caulobacter sp. TaxID=78 RepID=UPI003BABF0B4
MIEIENTGGSKIRRALVADALAVHTVLLAAKNDIPLKENFADAAHQDWVRGQCRQKNVWLDDRAGDIAGVMVMRANEIFYLVVATRFRRQGVGRALIRHALDYIRRKRWRGAKARIRTANAPIVRLLASEGFRPHPILAASEPGWEVYTWGDVG